MQKRVVQIIMLALLLSTVLAGFFLLTLEQRTNRITASEQDLNARLARMSTTIAGIGASQQSYIAPGQIDGPWFARTATLASQLAGELRDLRTRLRSPKAIEAFDALVTSCDALVDADNRIRQNLRLGQTLMAADVLFSDSRNILDVATARIGELREAEQAGFREDREAVSGQRWTVLGLSATAWIVVLVVVAVGATPAARAAPKGAERAETVMPAATPRPSIDLNRVAELCTDLSRIAATAALPGLLKRAASILDASGIILWMSAGEQLFAVTGYGYDPQVLPRLGPVSRDADNAAAVAWRTGKVTTVAADGAGAGAIVAPMFSSQSCFGVLACELRPQSRHDPERPAVAAMIAAQLATAVSTWPAASQARPVLELTLDEPDAVRKPA
jgi:hypothetical protein